MIRQQDLGDGVVALMYACQGPVNTLSGDLNRLLARADDALYSAKAAGRNATRVAQARAA